MKRWCILVAAGKGERAGLGFNKCFAKSGGITVLERALSPFAVCGLFDGFTVVVSDEDVELINGLRIRDCTIARGGNTRTQSVYSGLKTVPEDTDIVAIHDAARPFVTVEAIKQTVLDAEKYGSGVLCVPVTDTIKQLKSDGSVETPDRASLYAAQTPQVFSFRGILMAHALALTDHFEATDDAALYEKYISRVRLTLHPDAVRNIKLTSRSDFDSFRTMRIGHGFDAHRLTENRRLILCGVDIPYEKGLDGHSDADVALHALMDAMLGAAALGDIGKLFPDSDERFKGISSLILLRKVNELLTANGFSVSNADITIIAQRPKLAPYSEKMRTYIADAISCDISAISVKATTTEKMGFEGRGEGISAHAAVLLNEEI